MPTLPLPTLFLLRSKRSGHLFRLDEELEEFVDDVPLAFDPEKMLPALFSHGEVYGTDPRHDPPWVLMGKHDYADIELVRLTGSLQPLSC